MHPSINFLLTSSNLPSCPSNDFDWSEESLEPGVGWGEPGLEGGLQHGLEGGLEGGLERGLEPGAGWGEYVEEYEAALCVSLDIDRGFRWDTRSLYRPQPHMEHLEQLFF